MGEQGAVAWMFDRTNMANAKKTVGKVSCIAGNVPVSIAYTGTEKEMTAICRQLIEDCAPGGGYILTGGSTFDMAKPENLRGLQEYRSSKTLLVDPATLRNLEIFQSTRGLREGSLLSAIDRTATAAGARLLERWLAAPPLDLPTIRTRQAVVGEFLAQSSLLAELQGLLRAVRDIPRILGRLQNRLRTPRELGGIRETLSQLPALIDCLQRIESAPALTDELTGAPIPTIHELRLRVTDQPALRELLNRALGEELAGDLQEGGYIRAGYDAEVDRLRSLTRDS